MGGSSFEVGMYCGSREVYIMEPLSSSRLRGNLAWELQSSCFVVFWKVKTLDSENDREIRYGWAMANITYQEDYYDIMGHE